MRTTFHLVPADVWAAGDPARPYAAGSLSSEGFIHCTDGARELLETANRHYVGDLRPFIALIVDLDATGSPWRIEDAGGIYPHIFGPIERSAILGSRALVRDAAGRFLGLGEPTTSAQ